MAVVDVNVFKELEERGFLAQYTHRDEMIDLMQKESIPFYIGYDATADSLTVGHFMTIMLATHLQKAGHKPIVLIGGGTTMIGDPSDRTGMRSVMTRETIDYNAGRFKEQLSRFLDFTSDAPNKAIMVNNADWLLNLNYVDFLREVGIYFSVNKMLNAECYKSRLENEEKGLTFFEFNYMLMQAYDFYYLNKEYGCKAEFGGNDQWSNIIAGVNLIDKKLNKQAYGATITLLTTSDGVKMGKTMKGAVWLDEKKTSPYELFQYFRNVDDADVMRFLKLLTFIPLDELKKYEGYEGAQLNELKEILAFEITKLVHGQQAAEESLKTAKNMFGGAGDSSNLPTTEITQEELDEHLLLVATMQKAALIKSNGEGRRLIEQNGISLNEEKVKDANYVLTKEDFVDGKALIQKGKKVFHLLKLV